MTSTGGNADGDRGPERVANPARPVSPAPAEGHHESIPDTAVLHPDGHRGPEFMVPGSYPGQLRFSPGTTRSDSVVESASARYTGWQLPSASTAAEALDRPGYVGYPVPPGGHRTGGRYRRGRWSGVAIAAFATGCIPWIGVLAALPLGVVALVTIERTGERGKALAVAGMAMSVLIWVASVGILVAVFNDVARRDRTGTITAAGTLYFADIRMGDCLQVNDLETAGAVGLFDITGVPCAQTHNAESVGDVAFAEALYPGHAVLTQRAVQTCTQLAAQYVDPARRGLRPYLFAPTKELWDSDPGARRVMCFLTDQNFASLSDSVVR